ncbi:MAG: DUF4179 domain-containing protein [Gammaproteobacteria bacterium]|nr:DUF4179 domain-containing protein [Gammaproteobacteria bacterium]
MSKTDQDITFSIHDIIIRGNEVVVFFSNHNATNVDQAWPEIVHLKEKVLEGSRAIPQADFAVPPKKPLTILEQLDNVVLGALTFEIPEVHPPLLSMVVSEMIVQQEGVGESHLSGDWTVPLLEDQTPDRPAPYALQLFTTAPPEGIVYDGVRVFEGDDKGTNSGMAGAPEQTGGVTWFFAFTLSSPNEQKNVYLFLMADGTIQKVEQKDYLATLGLLYVQPTPLPATVPLGPDAEETFAPPSTTPTLVLRLEDVLKGFATPTPANQPVDVPTSQPFISPTGTAYPQAPGR